MVECEGNPVREEDDKLQMIVLLCRDLIASDELEVAGLSAVLADKSVPPQGAGS